MCSSIPNCPSKFVLLWWLSTDVSLAERKEFDCNLHFSRYSLNAFSQVLQERCQTNQKISNTLLPSKNSITQTKSSFFHFWVCISRAASCIFCKCASPTTSWHYLTMEVKRWSRKTCMISLKLIQQMSRLWTMNTCPKPGQSPLFLCILSAICCKSIPWCYNYKTLLFSYSGLY